MLLPQYGRAIPSFVSYIFPVNPSFVRCTSSSLPEEIKKPAIPSIRDNRLRGSESASLLELTRIKARVVPPEYLNQGGYQHSEEKRCLLAVTVPLASLADRSRYSTVIFPAHAKPSFVNWFFTISRFFAAKKKPAIPR